MSSTLRRFEILLPLRFNDGQTVPDELIGQTILELRQQFTTAYFVLSTESASRARSQRKSFSAARLMLSHMPNRFPTTAWSCIRATQDSTHPKFVASMNRLITDYWRPVYCYLRAMGHKGDDAEDLTQGFFLRFLAKGWIGRAEQAKGKFRGFLKTLVKRYAIDQTNRAVKQDKFEEGFVSVHRLVQDEDRQYEPSSGETPEDAFDRHWKAELLAAVRRNLQESYEGTGKPDDRTRYAIFAAYTFVDSVKNQPTQEELASRLGVTRDVVRYALSEVGKRYERFLRQEIRDQVVSEEEIDDELRGLMG